MTFASFFTIGILALALIMSPSGLVRATDDVVFTTTRLNNPGSVIIKVGQAIGFDISGLIVPIFNNEKQIATPKHEPLAKWKDAFNEFFTPQNYKDDGKHIDWDADAEPVFYTALYGAILKADAEHSNHPDPTDCYISEKMEKSSDIPFAPLDFQKAREVDAWIGISPVDPDPVTGVINWTLPSKTIGGMNPAEDCKKNELGFEMKPLENDLRQLAQFGTGTLIEGYETTSLFTTIVKWIDGIRTEETDYDEENKQNQVILTIKKVIPWYHTKTHDGGGPSNEAGPFSGNSPESGGWTAFTLREEDKKEMEDASLQPYQISVGGFPQKPMETSYDLIRQAAVRTEQARCYSLPDTSQSTTGNVQSSWFIGGVPPEEPQCEPIVAQCPIDLIEAGMGKSSSSCNLCNTSSYLSTDKYLTPLEKQALPNGIPPLMQKVLEAAGATYNVPASVLLGSMLEEGSFSHADTWKWTDETVRQWSDCTIKDPLPSCEEFAHPVTGAKGPFGFIQNWWDRYMKDEGPYKAYLSDPAWKAVLDKIPEKNITQCNFVDAAFNAARSLGEDHSHYQPEYVPPAPLQCTAGGVSYDLNIPTIPSSCSDWSAARTVLSRLQMGDRNCADGSIPRMANTYNGISCGGGNVSF